MTIWYFTMFSRYILTNYFPSIAIKKLRCTTKGLIIFATYKSVIYSFFLKTSNFINIPEIRKIIENNLIMKSDILLCSIFNCWRIISSLSFKGEVKPPVCVDTKIFTEFGDKNILEESCKKYFKILVDQNYL